MPLPSSIVGSSTDAHVAEIDARWIMAYAAGIEDINGSYLDTAQPRRAIVAHPLFPVCVEWPVVLDARRLAADDVLTRDERVRGVHATHDVRIHRLVRPGDVLSTTATVEAVERRRPGAYEVLRLDTIDADGLPVATTRMGTLFLGVDVDGADLTAEDPCPTRPGSTEPAATAHRDLGRGAAHIYTECARIWNPIHTDVAVAQAAGLPDIILHGTATLAMAVTAIVDHVAGRQPTRVRRIQGRFGSMVRLPSTIEIRIGTTDPVESVDSSHDVPFEVRTVNTALAISHGRVELASDPEPPDPNGA